MQFVWYSNKKINSALRKGKQLLWTFPGLCCGWAVTSAVQAGEEEAWGTLMVTEPAGLWKVHSQGCWGLWRPGHFLLEQHPWSRWEILHCRATRQLSLNAQTVPMASQVFWLIISFPLVLKEGGIVLGYLILNFLSPEKCQNLNDIESCFVWQVTAYIVTLWPCEGSAAAWKVSY